MHASLTGPPLIRSPARNASGTTGYVALASSIRFARLLFGSASVRDGILIARMETNKRQQWVAAEEGKEIGKGAHIGARTRGETRGGCWAHISRAGCDILRG